MEDFSYSQPTETSYNIKFMYGGEPFNFNLFLKNGSWILHPFDGILLGNQQMCSLVMNELFKYKPFQVMLAKQRISFSEIRSSIELESVDEPISIFRDQDQFKSNSQRDENMDFVEQNTVEEVIQIECDFIRERRDFHQKILERMFMDNLSPSDHEFVIIQKIAKIYNQAEMQMSDLLGPPFNFEDKRRW